MDYNLGTNIYPPIHQQVCVFVLPCLLQLFRHCIAKVLTVESLMDSLWLYPVRMCV